MTDTFGLVQTPDWALEQLDANNKTALPALPDTIDHDFLVEQEGFETNAYIPKRDGKILGISGPTVANGIDLGQQSEDGLRSAGVSESIISKVRPYLGLRGSTADSYLQANPLSLSDEEARALAKPVVNRDLKFLENKWNKSSSTKFSDLSREQRTVLASINHQYGDPSKGAPSAFWEQAVSGNWAAASDTLRNFGDIYGIRRNKEADLLEGVSSVTNGDSGIAEGFVQTPLWASQQAASGSMQVGGTDARMAMWPDEFADEKEDAPSKWERGYKGIMLGISGMAPATMTLAGGVLEFLGADELGSDVAQAGLGVDEWLHDRLAVENPQLFDHVMQGVGSIISFWVPGLGAAGAAGRISKGIGLAGKAATAFKAVTGAGAMSFLEASVEQSQRQQELMAQGQTPAEALANSQDVFYQNMLLLSATNLPLFSPAGRVVRKILKSQRLAKGVGTAVSEGFQERLQAVIQDVASGRGQWEDFFDPEKYQTETLVGSIVGGPAGFIAPTGGKKPATPTDVGEATPRPIGQEPAQPEAPVAPEDAPRVLEGAPDEVFTQQQVLSEIGDALSEMHGVEIDLFDRLTPEQLSELQAATEAAYESGDPAQADAAIEMAEGFLSEVGEDAAFDELSATERAEAEPIVEAPPATVEEVTEQVKLVEKPSPVTEDVPAPVVEPTIEQAPIETIEREAEKKAETKKSPEGFESLPLAAIETDPETFQVRQEGGEFDEDFVAKAVEDFDPQAVSPIEVWRDPKDGKFKIIDGHHTREILSRKGIREAAVKIFKGTREEAIAASQKRNDERRGNDVLAQAGVVRGQREAGQSKTVVNKEAKRLYGRNWTTVVALSHINPNGALMDAVRSFAGASDEGSQEIVRIAKWIGKVRENNPQLTDSHEQEMFDDLKKNMGGRNRNNQAEFTNFIDNLTDVFFEYDKPLNLKKLAKQNNVQREFDEQLRQAEGELKQARSNLEAARAKFVKAAVPQEALDALLKKYNDAVTIAQREVLALKERAGEVDKGGGEQAMFSRKRTGTDLLAKDIERVSSKVSDHSGPIVRLVETLAKRVGAKVQFWDVPDRVGHSLNGWFTPGTDTINININTKEPLLWIAAHELGHFFRFAGPRQAQQWETIKDVAMANLSEGGFSTYVFQAKAAGYSESEIEDEFVSDVVAEAMTRESFWRALKAEDRSAFSNLAHKVLDIIKSIRNIIVKNGDSMDIYFDNFAAIEVEVVKALSTAKDGKRAPITIDLDQRTLFSISEPRTDLSKAAVKRTKDGEAAVGAARSTVKSWRDWPRHFYQKMVDKNTWVYVAVRNQLKARGIDLDQYDASKRPDLILQTMGAWSEQAEMALKSVVTSWDNNTVLSDGLQVIIKRFGLAASIDNGEFGQYVIARGMRARRDGLAKDGKDYFGDDPDSLEYKAAKAEYDEMQAMAAGLDKLSPDWDAAVREISKWSNSMMTRLLQSGAISQAQHDGLTEKYDIYAPLFVLDEQQAGLPSGLQKSDATYAGKVTWESEVMTPGAVRMDPMQGYIKNVYRIEFLAASNHAKTTAAEFIREQSGGTDNLPGFGKKVGPPKSQPVKKKVDELLDAMGLKFADKQAAVRELGVDLEAMAKIWVAGNYLEDGTVAIMRDGEIEYWELEKDIYDAYASIGNVSSHALMKFFTAQTRLLRAGAVLTPEFMARNQMRDFLAAGVLSRHLVKNPVDAILLPLRIMRGLSHAIKKDQMYQDFIMDRAGHSSLVALDQENLRIHLEELNRSAGGVGFRFDKFVKNPVKFIVHSHPLTLLQAFSKLTENSTRLAVYEKARADLQSSGMTEAEIRVRAAIDSREASTDFGRSGEYGRIINMMIPFFNATVQGNDKMMRSLIRDKGNRSATWTRGALMVTMPSVLLWALNHDEEWYKEQPLWLKNHFWLFSLDEGKTIHKIPKPFEVGLLFGSLPERFLDWAADEDPEAMASWVTSLKKSFLVDPTDVMGPTVSALNDTRSNYDSFRDTPIVKGWLQKLEPRAQYTANTSEFAKWVGDTYPGRGLSPLMVDHFVKSAFGGIGQWSMEIASNIVMMADPKRKDMKPSSRLFYDTIPDWMPVIKAVTISTPNKYTRQMDEFYEQYDKSQEAVDTFRSYKSGGATKDQIASLYERTGVDIGLHESLVRAADAIGRVSKQIRNVQMAPADMFDRGEKRKKMDELMAQRNKMIDEYMKRFNDVDREKMQKQVDKTVDRLMREIEQSNRR